MRWRGSFEAALHDVSYDPFKIVSNVFSRDPDCLDALSTNPLIAHRVPNGIVAEIVRQAIDLYGDARGFAEEVEHKWPKGMLLAKLQAFGSQPQRSPEPDLGRAHSLSKLARLVDGQV